MECLPRIQEKLSVAWHTLSSIVKGPLASLPSPLKLLLSEKFGIPHELGSVIFTGVPNSSLTFSTFGNCWLMLLNSELYPNRASFTLAEEKTRVFESTHWLARVY